MRDSDPCSPGRSTASLCADSAPVQPFFEEQTGPADSLHPRPGNPPALPVPKNVWGPPGAQSYPGPQIARSQPVLAGELAGQSRISQFRQASPTGRPSATKRELWPPTACQSFDDGAPQDTESPYWDCSCRTRRRPDCRGSASHRRPESRTPAPRWPAVSCS